MKKITNDAYNTIFAELGRDWALITAQKDGKVNTMTAAWGGIGVMWGKDVAFVVVRPTRYTKEFLDAGDTFSLSFLPAEHKKTLSYFGSVSGREEDKIAKSGLAIAREDDIPYFEAADKVLLLKKLYAQDMCPEAFVDASLDAQWYPEHDYHTLYIAEITGVLEK